MSEASIARGDRLTLSLESWGRLGEAMARSQDRDIFVFGGIPGERVVAEVVRVWRKYIAARVVEVLESSEDRVQPQCPYYGECTGCQWQHVDYGRQLRVKQETVVDALTRVGGFAEPPVSPVLPSPSRLGYRNHARFTVGREGELGFVNRESRRFVRIDHCMLMHQGINDLLSRLQDKCAETTQLAIRAGERTGDFLVQPTLKNPDITVPSGQKHYLDSVNDRSFRVASPSFFQVNNEQTARLIEVVGGALDLKGNQTLLDAYTGVGTFAILLAPYVKKVIAVEESSAAVDDARQNAAGLENVEFITGKTEEVLPQLAEIPDVVLLDPPRSGCKTEALESLIKFGPPRVVYVSCDPQTLARDLRVLCESSYTLQRVQPLDMFPQTYHVECVAVLDRKEPAHQEDSAHQIILASSSPRRRELLAELGVDFQVVPADIPEDQLPGEPAQDLVRRLSLAKAREVAARRRDGYVIGADSVVVLNGRALGKPTDDDEARKMLRDLRGTVHQVTTGVTVIDAASGRALTDSAIADIRMREFSEEEMETSLATGTHRDKAGAYAVQDRDFRPAELLEGCYTNVVGLPLCRLVELLGELGRPVAPPPQNLPVTGGCRAPCPFRGEGAP